MLIGEGKTQLEFEVHNSDKYKVKNICNIAISNKNLENYYLLDFYYLVL